MTYAESNRLPTCLRQYRLYAGHSQLQLATRAGVALETVRKLERGDAAGMKIETILRFAAALEVAPSDLLPVLGSAPRKSDLPARRRRVLDPIWKRRNPQTNS